MLSKWGEDMKGLRGLWLYIAAGFYSLFLLSFLLSEEPRDLFFLNEVFMLPLVILLTIIVFQKEFGGYFSEVFATFPLCMAAVVGRKCVQLFIVVTAVHLIWVTLYRLTFGQLQTVAYDYENQEMVFTDLSWLELFAQGLPAYGLAAAVTVTGLIFTKKVYGGLGAGFALWMIEVLTMGAFLGRWTLFTMYMPDGATFAGNRTGLAAAAIVLLLMAAVWAGRREKWLTADDSY